MSIANAPRQFPSKPFVDELHATAEKISMLASRSLASDELSNDELVLFDKLVQRAADALTRIHEFHSREH
ncbi:hypothetical protein [Pseudaminobacter sp. NGMCC 1.201702]|uniref:hypothetical protein n=1 Tax=Pseudaminobacter sp. NGMCC 1.201702 TaxID=3391825 RepID=UPI0039F03573